MVPDFQLNFWFRLDHFAPTERALLDNLGVGPSPAHEDGHGGRDHQVDVEKLRVAQVGSDLFPTGFVLFSLHKNLDCLTTKVFQLIAA